jgi:hypothetical protein
VSSELPESLKKKMLEKIMREALSARRKEEEKKEDPEKIVWSRLSDEKARELMYKAKIQYPELYPYAVKVFYELIVSGKIGEFDGYTTLILLHRLGIPVKPDIRLRFVKHGKEVDLKDYTE